MINDSPHRFCFVNFNRDRLTCSNPVANRLFIAVFFSGSANCNDMMTLTDAEVIQISLLGQTPYGDILR